MIILPPVNTRSGPRSVKVPPQKLAAAVAFDLLMTALGLYALYETGEPLWLAAMMLLGAAPILWVVFSAARSQRADQSRPIVEDTRWGR